MTTTEPRDALPRAAMRVLGRVDFSGICWEWQGTVSQGGYGRCWVPLSVAQQSSMAVHRLVYEFLVGHIPDGLQLDHLCRNRVCCNPDHLEPVTPRENVMRSYAPTRFFAEQTHCSRGHEYTPENTYYRPNKPRFRYCRACMRRFRREKNARRKAERQANPAPIQRGEEKTAARLTAEQVMDLRARRANEGTSYRALAKAFGIGNTTVRDICLGLRWAHLPLPEEAKHERI